MVNPLIFKIGIGGAAVTGASATGIVYQEKIKNFVKKHFSTNDDSNKKKSNDEEENKSDSSADVPSVSTGETTQTNEGTTVTDVAQGTPTSTTSTYIIIKTTNTPDAGISKDLYETNDTVKNFKCVSNNKEDTECDIFTISDSAADNKLNNLSNIENSNEKAKQTNITNNTFFKLKLNDSLFTSSPWNTTQTVDIVSKDAGSDAKKYGTFTLQYKVTKTDDVFSVLGKTNWIIAKMTSEKTSETISDVTNLSCSIKNTSPESKESCSIFKIDGSFSSTSDILKTNTPSSIANENDFAKDKYFVLDLKASTKKDISELTNKTIIVATSPDNKQVGEFLLQSPLLDDSNAFTTASKIILLS